MPGTAVPINAVEDELVYTRANLPDIFCESCTSSIEARLEETFHCEAELDADSKTVEFTSKRNQIADILNTIADAGFDHDPKTLKSSPLIGDQRRWDTVDFYEPTSDSESTKIFLFKAILAGLIGIPLLVLEILNVIPHPMGLITQLVNGGIGVFILIVGLATSYDSFKKAWASFKQKTVGMDTLIVLGLTVTWVFSMLVCIMPHLFPMGFAHAHFSSIAIILMVSNFGKAIKVWAQKKAQKAAGSRDTFLEKYLVRNVLKLTDIQKPNLRETISFTDVSIGDYLVVPMGSPIPADGKIVGTLLHETIETEAAIHVDTEIYNGEMKPVEKKIGAHVESGMRNVGPNPIVIQAQKRATRSLVCRMYRAIKKRKKEPNITDKISKYFTPILILLALAAVGVWIAVDPISGWAFGVSAFVNVVMCACPCAMAIAAPLVQYVATQRALKNNICVSKPIAFERVSSIQHAVFDKTGTLTTASLLPNQFQNPEDLKFLAALEQNCNHPIAQAIVEAALQLQLPEIQAATLTEESSKESLEKGRKAFISGKWVYIGNRAYFEKLGANIFIETVGSKDNLIQSYYCIVDGAQEPASLMGMQVNTLHFEQKVRKEVPKLFAFLRSKNIAIHVATGDASMSQDEIAMMFSLNASEKANIHTKQTPANKAKLIRDLQKMKQRVMMVGDGSNDGLALQQADLGISLGCSDLADFGHVILPSGSLSGIQTLYDLGSKAYGAVIGNLSLTLVFNVVSVLVAAGVLFPLMGFMLPPTVLCAAMLLPTLFVIANAAFLAYRLKDEDEGKRHAAMVANAEKEKQIAQKLVRLNQFEKVLITGFVLFTALTVAGVVYTSMMGMGLAHLISMMTVPMALAGCAGCATLLSGVVGLGVLVLIAVVYLGVLIYREQVGLGQPAHGIGIACGAPSPQPSPTKTREREHEGKTRERAHAAQSQDRQHEESGVMADPAASQSTISALFQSHHNAGGNGHQGGHDGNDNRRKSVDFGANPQPY